MEKIEHDRKNLKIFKKMQEFSFLSGICISYSRTGLIHTISVALSKDFSQMHGELNSIIFPHVIDFNKDFYKIGNHQLDILLKLFGKKDLDLLVEYFKKYVRKLEFKLDENQEIETEDIISRIYQDKGLFTINPAPITKSKLKLLITGILRNER